MVFIIGASCLERAIEMSPFALRSSICRKSFSLAGLHLNRNCRNQFKDLGFLLERHYLKQSNNSVLWHDVINNAKTSQKSNDINPLILELLKILKKHYCRFYAILYCRRLGTPNRFKEQRTSNVTIIDAKKRFRSKRKQKLVFYTSELFMLHPWPAIEENSRKI